MLGRETSILLNILMNGRNLCKISKPPSGGFFIAASTPNAPPPPAVIEATTPCKSAPHRGKLDVRDGTTVY
jgi:hypothetical protein